jgi:DNA-binding transcriptional MerR regulator
LLIISDKGIGGELKLMTTTTMKYRIKNEPEKTVEEIIEEEYHDAKKNESETYFKKEIEKNYKNFTIIFQYLKNLCYYPEFEYSGLLDLDEIDRWEQVLETYTERKKSIKTNTKVLKDLRDFNKEIENDFSMIYKYNIKQYLKILKFKLEDIYQYLDVQRDGDMLALQSFKLPGGDDVISIYDIKREAMNIIYNRLDKLGKNIENINQRNIKSYNVFLEKTKQFISEFSYYETDGLDRNILFNFINEIYMIIPE